MSNWASVATPHTVYVGIEDRAEFDSIDLPPTMHPPRPEGRQCISKALGNAPDVTVIFQHWIDVEERTPA